MVKLPKLPALEGEKAELLASVMLAMLLGSLDQTVVTTAMPNVVAQLGGLSIFSWVFTAYMITSTIAIMLSGKIGDMKGRKNLYFYGVLIFIVGSFLSGISQDMLMLIIFRGLQGIGGGVMMISSMAILGDIFPPAERAKWQGIIGSVFAISSVFGPIAGALITEQIGWRWVFFVNLPLGLVVLYLLSRAKHVQPKLHGHELDIRGAAYFSVSIICFMVYIVSALGSVDPLHLALLVVSAVSFAMFVREERRAKEPVLPLDIFSNSTFVLISGAAFMISIAMFGALTFLPLVSVYVLGGKITDAGAALTPLMLSMFIGSATAGQIVSRKNSYKLVALVGCSLVVIGSYLIAQVGIGTTHISIMFAGVILGLGIGSMLPLSVVVVQNAFEHSRIGTVTSALTFFRSLGGAIGVAVMGALMNASGPAEAIMLNIGNFDAKTMMAGLHSGFLFMLAASVIPIFLMLLLKEIPLRKAHNDALPHEIGAQFLEEEAVVDEKVGKELADD